MSPQMVGRASASSCPGGAATAFSMSKEGKKPQAGAVNHSALLSKKQAADYLQVTPRYIERAVSTGRLLAFKPTGGLWRVRQSELDAFLDSGATIGGVS
jgi:excisionase family DNA binding protein